MTGELKDHGNGAEAENASKHPNFVLEKAYTPTTQRHRWGESQGPARVHWETIFYDLFFVAMAYNLGKMLLNDVAGKISLLYFVGLFFPCCNLWFSKMRFDSRFEHGLCIYNRMLNSLDLFLLATAVLHIGEVKIMRDPSSYVNMFAFSISIVLTQVLQYVRSLDIYRHPETSIEAKNQVLLDFTCTIPVVLLDLVAVFISGLAYFGNDNEHGKTDESHRYVAEEKETNSNNFNDIPVILCLVGYFLYHLIMFIKIVFFFPKNGEHKKQVVPMNIHFNIHRASEWVMLMLGETILDLHIVDVPIDAVESQKRQYYATYYCGIITAIAMQYHHFQSEPHDPDFHATRLNKNAGLVYGFLSQYYSLFLVAVGVSYKLLLTEFINVTDHDDGYHRSLADCALEASTTEETATRQLYITKIFGVSLCLALFILDLMTVTHTIYRDDPGPMNKFLIFLSILKTGLIVFSGLIFRVTHDPMEVAIIGTLIMTTSVIIRIIVHYELDKYFKKTTQVSSAQHFPNNLVFS